MNSSQPEPVCSEIVRMLKAQRHDFVSHIQVVYALLQLGKVERARTYLEKLAKDTDIVNETVRLHYQHGACPKLAGKAKKTKD